MDVDMGIEENRARGPPQVGEEVLTVLSGLQRIKGPS